jgi:hypothetical protein
LISIENVCVRAIAKGMDDQSVYVSLFDSYENHISFRLVAATTCAEPTIITFGEKWRQTNQNCLIYWLESFQDLESNEM